jgi:hypothetical protein
MGCGASRPFASGWTRDPLSGPEERAEQRRQWELRQDEVSTALLYTNQQDRDGFRAMVRIQVRFLSSFL